MFNNEILMIALLPCVLKKAISPDIISNDLGVDKNTAENIIRCLTEKGIIFNYNPNKKVNMLMSYQNFEKTFSSLNGDLKKEIEKDLCLFNEKINISNGQPLSKTQLDDELKERTLNLLKSQKQVSTFFLQKNLEIGYANACKIIDWLLEQKLIKKSTTYEVV